MSLKKKLASVLDSFENDAKGEIWGDWASAPESFVIHMDTANHNIGVYAVETDAKGRPVSQWEMNTQTGHITETKRAKDGSEVQVTHRDVAPASLEIQPAKKEAVVEQKEVAVAVEGPAAPAAGALTGAPDQWEDLEVQRDLAFKIMYFFIVFIIATLGLLYAFFKMTQKSEQEAAMRKGAKAQRERDQESTFMDFLAGRLDEDTNVVNAYAQKQANRFSSQFTSASTPFANLAAESYMAAHEFARKAQGLRKEVNNTCSSNEHRGNSGFGANNLVHLADEERGRFDDLQIDSSTKHPESFPFANL